jgi:hypothetical protein
LSQRISTRVVEGDLLRPVLGKIHPLHERHDAGVEGTGGETGRPAAFAKAGFAVGRQNLTDEVLVVPFEADE